MIYLEWPQVEVEELRTFHTCDEAGTPGDEQELYDLKVGDVFMCRDHSGELILDDSGNYVFRLLKPISYDKLLGPVLECEPVEKK